MHFYYDDVAEKGKEKKKTTIKKEDYILQILLGTFAFFILFKDKFKIKENYCHAQKQYK